MHKSSLCLKCRKNPPRNGAYTCEDCYHILQKKRRKDAPIIKHSSGMVVDSQGNTSGFVKGD